MKKLCLASAALIALSGGLFADSITNGTGSFQSITGTPISTFISQSPTFNASSAPGITANTPFWNNPSSDGVSPPPVLADGHVANIGDVLAGLATGTNLIGSNLTGTPSTSSPVTSTSINGSYYAQTGGTDPAATSSGTSMTPALEFSFVSNQVSQTVSLLFADSGNDTGVAGQATSIGTYIVTGAGLAGITTARVLDSAVSTYAAVGNGVGTQLFSGTNLVTNAGTVYGYYATVCYAWTGTTCNASITYTSGAGNFASGNFSGGTNDAPAVDLGALGWNHFALFQLASGEFALGFTDTPYALSTNVEGEGDFNDVVLGITGNAAPGGSSTPEPATMAIMGLGLAGLGILGRRRFGKK